MAARNAAARASQGVSIPLERHGRKKSPLIHDANDYHNALVDAVERQIAIDRKFARVVRDTRNRRTEMWKVQAACARRLDPVEGLIAQFRSLSAAPAPDLKQVSPRGICPA